MTDAGRRAWRAVMQATGTLKAAFDDDFRSQTDIDIQGVIGIQERVTQHLTVDEARVIAEAFERVRLANSENVLRLP